MKSKMSKIKAAKMPAMKSMPDPGMARKGKKKKKGMDDMAMLKGKMA